MSLLKADIDLTAVIIWLNENIKKGYNMERNKNIDYLITFEGGKWCLYDVLKGVKF